MARILLIASIIFNLILLSLVLFLYNREIEQLSPLATSDAPSDFPLNRYAFDELRKEKFVPGPLRFGEVIASQNGTQSRMFYFDIEGKTVSGLSYLPEKQGEYPVIIMLRGYVDKNQYKPGVGTRRSAEVFARNGYITLAPDFLGYGESDAASIVPFEDRLQTITTALQLLSNLSKLNDSFVDAEIDMSYKEGEVGIWGHSNGGQIAIALLEITEESYPTVLWAPVTKQFPYSVLYFTDEFEDQGRYLRGIIADFEDQYDITRFTIGNNLSGISAPIQLHQGGRDDAVPQHWSDEFEKLLTGSDVEVDYYVYPEADHNMMPDWNTVVERSLDFFTSKILRG